MGHDGGSPLISSGYLAEQKRLHELGGYGLHGDRFGPKVAWVAHRIGAQSILDYGCGAGTLKQFFHGIEVREYDPAIPGKDEFPEPADLVVCTDVMEHIEPQYVKRVGQHLHSLSRLGLFVAISTRLAGKKLSDGSNAHVLVWPATQWREFFEQRGFAVKFDVDTGLEEWVAFLRRR